ncbi:MAG: glutamine--tRNA ligase, partial [Candidatus Omnitrophica bacterium]|nr:glutamine--tRNA ligase [Candidatus Omnitrophota bacterium]
EADVHLYDTLFTVRDPTDVPEGKEFTVNLNSASLERLSSCKLEPALAKARPGDRYQFERMGYFVVDAARSPNGTLVFNRTVTLRDTWAKIEKKL